MESVQRYDAMTIILHWFTAVLVLVLWVGARALHGMPPGALRADGRSLHIVLGLFLGALGGGRFVWRLSFGRPLPPTDSGWMGTAARLTHGGLYTLLAAMVLIGILLAWMGGDSLFNQFTPAALDADNQALAEQLRRVHSLIGWAIVAVVAAHSAAVLFHHYALKDSVLARMMPRGGLEDDQ